MVICPHCKASVTPTGVGRCPSCREFISSPGAESDPYASSKGVSSSAYSGSRTPFVHQAAKFSALAPVCIVFLSLLMIAMEKGPEHDRTIGAIFGSMNALLAVLGLLFGIIGLIGGIRLGWWSTIAMSLIGCLLNGLIVLSVVAAILFAMRIANQPPKTVSLPYSTRTLSSTSFLWVTTCLLLPVAP